MPNGLTLACMATGFLFRFWIHGWSGVLFWLVSVSGTLLFLLLFRMTKALGAGDVKLLAAVMPFYERPGQYALLAAVLLLGAALGLVSFALRVNYVKHRGTWPDPMHIPFGLCMACGGLAVLLSYGR